jgi:hypothetical protein
MHRTANSEIGVILAFRKEIHICLEKKNKGPDFQNQAWCPVNAPHPAHPRQVFVRFPKAIFISVQMRAKTEKMPDQFLMSARQSNDAP